MVARIIRFQPRTVPAGRFAPITPSLSPTVVFVTAVWGRLAVTRVWWAAAVRSALQLNAKGIKTRIVVGGSEPEHRALCEENGGEWVETPNRPLGAKWNNICEAAFKETDSEYMLVLGSDDVMSPAMVDGYVIPIKKGTPYAGLQSCNFYNTANGRLFNFSQFGVTVGCGRLLHRNLLKLAEYRPWNETKEKGLDRSMDDKILRGNVLVEKLTTNVARWIVDIKSQENIWSYNTLRGVKAAIPDLPTEQYMRLLPEWEAIKALTPPINP